MRDDMKGAKSMLLITDPSPFVDSEDFILMNGETDAVVAMAHALILGSKIIIVSI